MFTEVTDKEFKEKWLSCKGDNELKEEIKFEFEEWKDSELIDLFERNRFTFFTLRKNDKEQRLFYFGARTILQDIVLIEFKAPSSNSHFYASLKLKAENRFMLEDMHKTVRYIVGDTSQV